MAEAVVVGAVVGTAVNELYEFLEAQVVKNLACKSLLEEIISRLNSLKPLLQQMTNVYSNEELQGLVEVIKEGKALVGGYLVRERYPKKKDVEKFDEWEGRLKRQLEMLIIRSLIDGRKTAVNMAEMLPLVRDTKAIAQNTEVAVQQLQLDGRKAVDNTEEIKSMVQQLLNCSSDTEKQNLSAETERSSDTEKQNLSAENEAYCAVPELPPLTVGLDGPLKELKRMIFKDGNSMIVVNAMGGSGKTTLAIKFCRDPQVKDIFKNNIFFVTVSENFKLELIVQQLHQRKGLQVPVFTSQENAVTWLQTFLRKKEHNPLLLVLDDVWPDSEKYLGKFQSKEMKEYKILVTSRSQLQRFGSQDSQYKLEALNGHDAMELFNHSINSSPDPELSKTIVDSCKGLPLLLTVVGGSLSGQHIDIWRTMSSKGIHEDEVYDCLQRSLDVDKNMKEYFLDLGAFPDHKRISVGALIDMWAELYYPAPDRDGLIHEEEEEEDTLCNAKLIKLKNRNLANLVDTRKDKIDEDRYRKGDYVTLHDLLKEQAIQNSGLGLEEQRTRLIVNICGDHIPRWWGEQKFQARLVSVSTDSEFSKKLPNMTLEKAEVLMLNFRTKKYLLPEFVKNMAKLRVLFVKYDGSSYQSCAELDNFEQVGSLPNLKRITLERVSTRSITENPFKLNSLLKMSLILCDLSPAFSNGRVKISDAFPKLEELIIDRCNNCKEFLTKCCDLVHLIKLSIINCRGLDSLPETIGNLVNLQVLRLRSCSDLSILPDSVANLNLLKFLDISECSSISNLPTCIGKMSSLIKLDLRYCQDTVNLRQSVLRVKQLKDVICTCTYSTYALWKAVKPSHGRIRILVVKGSDGKFSSGLESAKLVLTSDPVHQAWNAIEKQKEINPNAEPCLFNEIQPENPTIIAFGTPPISLQGREALVSSSNLKEDNFAHFEFLCNRSNPNFSLSQAAIKLFQSHYHDLLQLKDKLVENGKRKTPSLVIITGQSVGGSVATVFTLWLLQGLDLSKTKRPLCVTFGSPLVGDEQLRRCVLKFSTWKSCFLHVVSNQDPTPQLFISRNPGAYKPFGTFLLCSALGCACFEDPDFILEQLVKTRSQNQECHYGNILSDLKCNALCNVSNITEADIDSLQVTQLRDSLIIQFQAIGILSQHQPSTEIDRLIRMTEEHEIKNLFIQKKKKSDSHKRLNEMKVHMAFLEWYKKDSRQPKIGGYYDRYRNQGNISDKNVSEFKIKLMNYWEDCITEVETNPQIEGGHFRFHWLWAGTYYRRMVEPLHIADYYRNGGKSYKADGKRRKHFIMLEEWLPKAVKSEATSSKSKRETVGSRLNEDSCFWADVEEARILCNLVKNGSVEERERALQELKNFEADVYDSLKDYALSPEIFLKKSSFMQWLKEYKGVVQEPYPSLLLEFMRDRSYEAYKEGKFIFP